MHLIDWIIVVVPLVVVALMALHSRRYLRSVVDFTAGGRLAGRYLLATAASEMGAGAIAYVSAFEIFGHSAFSLRWWGQLSFPASLIVVTSGFVTYRYRQTRALTLAQFFEMRYSRRFRLFTGVLAVFAGLLNFGVIPVVGARFMVHFLEFPAQVQFFSLQVPTHLLMMACLLTITTLQTISGGQVTVILTDCVQGIFSQVFYVAIIVALLLSFHWSQTSTMLLARPPGESLVNPFDSFGVKDFNLWYVLMGIFGGAYGTMAWQNRQGFNACAVTPHESRMGGILGQWRGFALGTTMILLALASMTYVSQAEGSVKVQQALARIPDMHTREQMGLAMGLSQILPMGVKGLLVAVVIMGVFGGDGMHLHSWSSIFIQDIVVPLRRRPMSTREHLIFLRLAVVGVALFAFCFGACFQQTEYLSMWFTITTAIYVGGAGACIIGGLYWSRGTTAGAWAGLLTGSILSSAGILLRQPACADVVRAVARWVGSSSDSFADRAASHLGSHFALNGVEISFYAALLAVASYIVVSLLTCRTPHDMDRLLRRGIYAVELEAPDEPTVRTLHPGKNPFHLHRLIGIDEHFTFSDRCVTLGIFGWGMLWFVVFLVGSAWYLIRPWSGAAWANYWLVNTIIIPAVLAVATTVWFTIGCWYDIKTFYRRLRGERFDPHDDGTVDHESNRQQVRAQPIPSADVSA